jgi:hypothetical protein
MPDFNDEYASNPKRADDPAEWACLSDEQRDIIESWAYKREKHLYGVYEKQKKKDDSRLTNSALFGLFIIAAWYQVPALHDTSFLVFLLNIAARWLFVWLGFYFTGSLYHHLCADTDDPLWERVVKSIVFIAVVIIAACALYNAIMG